MTRPTTIYAIGDVHGMLAHLLAILAWVESDAKANGRDAHVLLLGDLIDRGPDSKGVVELVRKRTSSRFAATTCLMGNHDWALEWSLCQSTTPHGFRWLKAHAVECLASYGVDLDLVTRRRQPTGAEQEALSNLAEDAAWLAQLPRAVTTPDRIFCHAGMDPTIPPDEQDPSFMLWGHEDFRAAVSDDASVMHPAFSGRSLVHGHYPIHRGPEIRRLRTNLDTGCCFGGRLTCAAFDGPGAKPRFAQTRNYVSGPVAVTRHDL